MDMKTAPVPILPAPAEPKPPAAARRMKTDEYHGVVLEDPYAWLRDPGYPQVADPEILGYLEAENAYFDAVMEPHRRLTDTLFEEIKGRIRDDDESVPVRDGGFEYWWRFAKGAEYRTWLRRPVGADGVVILDEPMLAEGCAYFRLRDLAVSPDDGLLAFSADTDGSERYTIRIKDLASGEVLPDEIGNTNGAAVWAEGPGHVLLYIELSDQLRPFRIRAHRLGDDPADDPVIYEETDSSFFVGVGKTRSRVFLTVEAGDHVTSEVRLIRANDPFGDPVLVAAREAGHEYDVDHAGDRLFIRTNDTHRNFRLATAPIATPGQDHWREFAPGDDACYLRGVDCFREYLALQERVSGVDRIRLMTYTGEVHEIDFPEDVYSAGLGANPEFHAPMLRLGYTSMITPATVYDYDVAERRLVTRKVQEIPSGYDKTRYATERLEATARDGTKVPISVVYPKEYRRNAGAPLHLYGYGAYGLGMTPSFSAARLSLLDRGFAYAIAHIRGGDELGYGWYEDGKLDRRNNTFTDFVDCAEHLIANGFGSRGGITISGGSAGGTLVGACLNMAPDLWRGAVAHVPFVDVLNTMLDDTLPLTPIEWPEWGHPGEDQVAFETIRGYSPYDNVTAQPYPPLLVTAGLSDPRVTYWEPAKWVARLRAEKTDGNVLLLKTNMGAGHGGKSGRFEAIRETAEEYTFLLMCFGKAD